MIITRFMTWPMDRILHIEYCVLRSREVADATVLLRVPHGTGLISEKEDFKEPRWKALTKAHHTAQAWIDEMEALIEEKN